MILTMKFQRLRAHVYIVALMIVCVVLGSCSVNPLTDEVAELTPVVMPKTVTDLSATTTGEGKVTVSFTGQDNADGYGIYYDITYQTGPEFSPSHTCRIVPTSGQTAFSKSFTVPSGTHMLFSVVTSIPYETSKGTKAVLQSASSAVVEGVALPLVELSSLVEGSKVQLYWDTSSLHPVLTSGSSLYASYAFILKRTTGDGEPAVVYQGNASSYQDVLVGSSSKASYQLFLDVFDGTGSSLLVSPLQSDPLTVSADASSASLPAESLSATHGEGAKSSEVLVSWTLPDFITISGAETMAHRVLLERSVHDADAWMTLITKDTDINTASYGYTALNSDGKASYAYADTTVEKNTLYDYRVTTYYLLNKKSYMAQNSATDPVTTEQPGYAAWLPTDLAITNADTAVSGTTVSPSLSWSYDEPEGLRGTFILTRIDAFGSSDLAPVQETTLHDSITLTKGTANMDSRYDHTYTYTIRLKYADDTTSDAIEGTGSVTYKTDFEAVDYIRDLSVSDDLSDKVVLSWTVATSVMKEGVSYPATPLSAANLSYTIQKGTSLNGLSSSDVVLDSTIEEDKAEFVLSGDTMTVTLDEPNGSANFYRIHALYSDATNENYDQTEAVVIKQGATLAVPSSLAVDDGVSETVANVSFSSVAKSSSYMLRYRVKGTTDWTQLPLAETTKALGTEMGSGTKEAGTVYEFTVCALDKNGTETAASAVEEGSLFGPALLNASLMATKNSSNNAFTVSWNPVVGATEYTVSLYRDDGAGTLDASTYIGQLSMEADGSSSYTKEFLSTDSEYFTASESNPYPLSESYTVMVVPSNAGCDGIAESMLDTVTGCWFGPPKGITASKAASGTEITVSWSAVSGATSYNLYGSNDGNTWSKVGTYGSSIQKVALSTTDDTYYTLESFNGTLTRGNCKNRKEASGLHNHA